VPAQLVGRGSRYPKKEKKETVALHVKTKARRVITRFTKIWTITLLLHLTVRLFAILTNQSKYEEKIKIEQIGENG
jgi:hypothetical protein